MHSRVVLVLKVWPIETVENTKDILHTQNFPFFDVLHICHISALQVRPQKNALNKIKDGFSMNKLK